MIPELPAPTGLPAQAEQATSSEGEPTQTSESTAEVEVPTGDSSTTPPPEPQLPDPPPAPPHPQTQLQESPETPEGGSDPALAESGQAALQSIQFDASQINTQPGPPPQVDLSGEADPERLTAANQASAQEVQQAKLESATTIDQDFGEGQIFPKATDEILKPNQELSPLIGQGARVVLILLFQVRSQVNSIRPSAPFCGRK